MGFLRRVLAVALVSVVLAGGAGCFGSDHSVTPRVSDPAPISVGEELPDVPGSLDCSFTWEYAGSKWTWDIEIPRSLYEYYSERKRVPTENYSVYVTDPSDDPFIGELVDRFEDAAQQERFDEFETVNFAVAFVQSLPYTSDAVTTAYDEYPRYPVETLVDDGGDCEDTSILMAAILDAMGYGVVLLQPPHHMAVGVLGGEGIHGTYFEQNGGKYFYLETTGSGWEIGETPSEYEGEKVDIFGILPTPILSHRWTAKTYESDAVMEVTVRNLGTATASEVYVLAGFDAGEGIVWNAQESERFDLEPGYYVDVTLTLWLPQEESTRLLVQTVYNGYAFDESYSEWFDT